VTLATPADYLQATSGIEGVSDQRLDELRHNIAQAEQDFEDAKRVLEQVRGAMNDCEWLLRNYFPGDAAVQDVPRTDRSITPEDLTT
jgi:hypothetical protein